MKFFLTFYSNRPKQFEKFTVQRFGVELKANVFLTNSGRKSHCYLAKPVLQHVAYIGMYLLCAVVFIFPLKLTYKFE